MFCLSSAAFSVSLTLSKALKHGGKDSQHGPRAAVTASASSLPASTPQTPSQAGVAAAEKAARISKEVDEAFDELTISLANKPGKPVEPIIRCKFHPGRVAYKAGSPDHLRFARVYLSGDLAS